MATRVGRHVRSTDKSQQVARVRQNNPTGKTPKVCPSLCAKIFRLRRRANQRYQLAVSPGKRGVAHVTNARWDAVDATDGETNGLNARTAKSRGPEVQS